MKHRAQNIYCVMHIHFVRFLALRRQYFILFGKAGTCNHAQIREDNTSCNYWEMYFAWEGCSTAKPLNSYNSSVGVVSSSYNDRYLLTSVSMAYVETA